MSFYNATLNARLRRTLSVVTHSLYLDSNGETSKTVFICGSGRSGTTWLSEVLNYDNRYRFIYEPFNRDQVSLSRVFTRVQYLRPDNADPRYLLPATEIFNGRVRNAWVDQYNRAIMVQQRLVKDVRSTLMLKWIRLHFPHMPIVLIMRHPCAVAASRTRRKWKTNLRDDFLDQRELVQDYLSPFMDCIQEANSPFEQWIVYWCIENLVPFSQLEPNDVYVAFYENLVSDPMGELAKVCSHIGRPFDPSSLWNMRKPPTSTHARYRSTRPVWQASVASWREYVSDEQLTFAQDAIRRFGLSGLYPEDGRGDIEAAVRLLSMPRGPLALPSQARLS